MSSSRTVRIPKSGAVRGGRAVRVPVAGTLRPPIPSFAPGAVRENRGGVQRANRLALVYVAALLAVFGVLALYARSAPGGTTGGATQGLAIFAGVALLLAVAGILVALGSAPRRVELTAEATVVQGRFGGRLRLPPRAELDVRVLRTFSAGLLSSRPVELVEVAAQRKGRRRTFLTEAHLLDPRGPEPPAA